MKPYAEKLKAGKERMRQLCIQAALTNTPAAVRVVRIRKTLSGRAYSAAEIAAPRPVTRRALHIFLHECAHVALGHVKADKAAQFAPTLPHGGPGPVQAASGTAVTIKLPRVGEKTAVRMAVLLDDDLLVHMNWKMAAKAAGAELKPFKTPEDFSAGISDLPKDTPIYIDSELGNDVKGEDIAKDLHGRGFSNLTMATGHGPEKFAHLPWLKVAGKEPPWA
jgi:hypothetical protein